MKILVFCRDSLLDLHFPAYHLDSSDLAWLCENMVEAVHGRIIECKVSTGFETSDHVQTVIDDSEMERAVQLLLEIIEDRVIVT